MDRKRTPSGLLHGWPSGLAAVPQRIAHLIWVMSRSTLALVGLTVFALTGAAVSRPDWRAAVEETAFGFLHVRHVAKNETAPLDLASTDQRVSRDLNAAIMGSGLAANRVPAVETDELTQEQAAVAQWIARRYKVAAEPIGRVVQEAWYVGQRVKLEPTLILAIMAVESSFNPYAQSSVGAQGLMQVMTRVHDKKFEPFGGTLAAFDPLSNLHVGVQVLKECIARAGSVYDGLRHYVGAANHKSDGGYASKVLGEHQHLQKVALGQSIPHTAPIVPVVPTSAAAPASTPPASNPTAASSAPSTPTASGLALDTGPAAATPAPTTHEGRDTKPGLLPPGEPLTLDAKVSLAAAAAKRP
jgi:hypothetical protein